jgi:hypothetical protein
MLEVVKLSAGSSVRIWKMNVMTLWRSRPPPKRKKRLLAAYKPPILGSCVHTARKNSNGGTPFATRDKQP